MKALPRERLAKRVADLFELPRDIVLDLPKVTFIGNLQVFVENHQGIIEYQPERVRINTTRGELQVTGRNLAIGSIGRDEIVIEGRIKDLIFTDWSGD
jgi:sporulation protein YqfC